MMLTVCLCDIKIKKINLQYSKFHMKKLPIYTDFEQYKKSCQRIRVIYKFVLRVVLFIYFYRNMRISLIKEALLQSRTKSFYSKKYKTLIERSKKLLKHKI